MLSGAHQIGVKSLKGHWISTIFILFHTDGAFDFEPIVSQLSRRPLPDKPPHTCMTISVGRETFPNPIVPAKTASRRVRRHRNGLLRQQLRGIGVCFVKSIKANKVVTVKLDNHTLRLTPSRKDPAMNSFFIAAERIGVSIKMLEGVVVKTCMGIALMRSLHSVRSRTAYFDWKILED